MSARITHYAQIRNRRLATERRKAAAEAAQDAPGSGSDASGGLRGLRRRPFVVRLWRSYRAWRNYLSPIASIRAAWKIARLK